MQTKTIDGKTITGEDRKYTFQLMTAEDGLKLFHELLPVVLQLIPSAKDDTINLVESGKISLNLIEIVKNLPHIINWAKLVEISKTLCAFGTCEANGKKHDMGPSGIGEYTQGDPMEVYTAIFYALAVNYPKYIGPLLGGLGDNDTSPKQ